MRTLKIIYILLLATVSIGIAQSEENNYFLDARSKAAVLTLSINGKVIVVDSSQEEDAYATSSSLIDLHLKNGINKIEVFYDRKEDLEEKGRAEFAIRSVLKGSLDPDGGVELARRDYGKLKGKFWHFSDAGDEPYISLLTAGEVNDQGFLRFQVEEIDGGSLKQVIGRDIGTEPFPKDMDIHEVNLGLGVPEWLDSMVVTVKGTQGVVKYSLIKADEGVFKVDSVLGVLVNIGNILSVSIESAVYDDGHEREPVEVGHIAIQLARAIDGNFKETIEIHVDGIPPWPWLEGAVVSPDQLTAEDRSQINQLLTELADAINSKDIERVSIVSVAKIKVASLALGTSVAAQEDDFRSFMAQIVFSGGFQTAMPLSDLDYENVNDRILQVRMNGDHPIRGLINGPETGPSNFSMPIFVSKINNVWTLVR